MPAAIYESWEALRCPKLVVKAVKNGDFMTFHMTSVTKKWAAWDIDEISCNGFWSLQGGFLLLVTIAWENQPEYGEISIVLVLDEWSDIFNYNYMYQMNSQGKIVTWISTCIYNIFFWMIIYVLISIKMQ